jgi:amidase
VLVKPLYELSATEQARLIASGEVSSREVIEAHLARIDAINPRVNAITRVLRESALKAADAADAADRAHRGPLHGVPFTVKENIDCLGSPTTHGIAALKNVLPSSDAPVVGRMKAAGAIAIGRTNQPEFGLRLCTDNPLYGATLNPFNPYLTPGGSSGGEGVALATGMTPFGLGNDLCGSLRNPAYCCGVAALKPTLGRIPRATSIPPLDSGFSMQALTVEGPMARSVADLRVGLSILAGRDIRDPRSVDVPLIGPTPRVRRAALATTVSGMVLPRATLAEIRRAGEILAKAGWEIELAVPPELDLVYETWLNLIILDYSANLRWMRPMLSPPVNRYMTCLCQLGNAHGISNQELHATRSRLTRLWSGFFAQYPVVLGPTWTKLPWPVDADLELETGLPLVRDTVQFITPANLLGIPAVALPMGVVDGIPTGIQIYADLWREDLCLEAAETIERGANRVTPIDPVG